MNIWLDDKFLNHPVVITPMHRGSTSYAAINKCNKDHICKIYDNFAENRKIC